MAESSKVHRIFVYGTLKRGQYYHADYLIDSLYLGNGRTSNDYTLYVEALPFMVKEPSDGPIKGELFEVNPETLRKIDELEGHPRVYKRELIEVMDDNNVPVTAWAYLYPNIFKDKSFVLKEYEWL